MLAASRWLWAVVEVACGIIGRRPATAAAFRNPENDAHPPVAATRR